MSVSAVMLCVLIPPPLCHLKAFHRPGVTLVLPSCPVRYARKGERTTVSYRDAARNGKPKACASCLTRTGLIHTVKAFTEVQQVFGINADPVVTYLYKGLFIFRLCAHYDMTSGITVFNGIVEQHQ